MRYRKKPVVIDAVQLRAGEVPHELDDAVIAGKIKFCEDGTCTQIGEAEQHLCAALRLLRENGWPEVANDLRRIHGQLQVWTQQPGGYLTYLEPPPKPAGPGRGRPGKVRA